jgi:hypothetical protein
MSAMQVGMDPLLQQYKQQEGAAHTVQVCQGTPGGWKGAGEPI